MQLETSTTTPARSDYLPALVAVCLYAIVVLRTAWLSDDAYITFRTVDNFVNGYGLTWNVAERVQAYTHPLWMFMLSGVYLLSPEIFYFTSILLCVLFSVATVVLFATRVAVAALPALVGTTVFILSKAFVDYSTSGLENPLTHFVLMVFLFVYLTRPASRKTLLWLSLLAGLLTLNRMDAILLVLPALCVALYHVRGLRALGVVVLGFAPFLAWEAFALFYYGSPLPNTAYAKLNNGIAAGELIRQGLLYLLASLKLDPLTPIVIVAGLVVPLITRQRRHVPLALGSLLYLFYVVGIGGDFMLGRFLTPPLLIGVALLARVIVSGRASLLMFLAVGIIGAAPPRSPLSSGKDYGATTGILVDKHGVCDERGYYFQGTGLLLANRGAQWPDYSYARQGRRAHERGERVVVAKCIGMFGFFAGPDVHIVDELALADPLLARLAPLRGRQWRPGHYHRRIPDGYIETLETGQNLLADAQLAAYYDKLRFITRGELWDPQRWLEILKFNLGAYDHLLPTAQ
jgi:arabinofuranosyltransferase